eukprot:TRINITY_DN30712_c0_g1_i1.p1 TRINITY_DN30712_c0_g1~~TRINITY_DN30712_c0_g1_i1.p1  ORF type:complete len:339 (-),score=49.71 TRINITY_DN30712_c0_g1_i1:47-1063(-)
MMQGKSMAQLSHSEAGMGAYCLTIENDHYQTPLRTRQMGNTAASVSSVALTTMLGVMVPTLYLALIWIGTIPRGRRNQPEKTDCVSCFPVFRIERSHSMFLIHNSASIFLILLSFFGVIETLIGDPSMDSTVCTPIWQVVVFFSMCFEVTILWFLFLRAEIFSAYSHYESVIRVFKIILAIYSVCLPIILTIYASGVPMIDDTIGSYCHLNFPIEITTTFITTQAIFELSLFMLFLLPLRDLIRKDRENNTQSSGASTRLSSPRSALMNSHDEERIEKMERFEHKGVGISLFILLINIGTFFSIQVDVSGVAEFLAGFSFSFLFFALVFATREAWSVD